MPLRLFTEGRRRPQQYRVSGQRAGTDRAPAQFLATAPAVVCAFPLVVVMVIVGALFRASATPKPRYLADMVAAPGSGSIDYHWSVRERGISSDTGWGISPLATSTTVTLSFLIQPHATEAHTRSPVGSSLRVSVRRSTDGPA